MSVSRYFLKKFEIKVVIFLNQGRHSWVFAFTGGSLLSLRVYSITKIAMSRVKGEQLLITATIYGTTA